MLQVFAAPGCQHLKHSLKNDGVKGKGKSKGQNYYTTKNDNDGKNNCSRSPDKKQYESKNNQQYINLSSKGNGQDFGKLSIGTYNAAKSQGGNSTRGLIGGGYIAPASATTNTIEYITIATLGNGIDFGDLTEARTKTGATSNATRGIFMGGDPGPGSSNIIDYVTVASTGNAADFGDIPTAYQDTAALSDTHGGLE